MCRFYREEASTSCDGLLHLFHSTIIEWVSVYCRMKKRAPWKDIRQRARLKVKWLFFVSLFTAFLYGNAGGEIFLC